jgi:hypothetical protein
MGELHIKERVRQRNMHRLELMDAPKFHTPGFCQASHPRSTSTVQYMHELRPTEPKFAGNGNDRFCDCEVECRCLFHWRSK